MLNVQKRTEDKPTHGYDSFVTYVDHAHLIRCEYTPDDAAYGQGPQTILEIGFGLNGRSFKYDYKTRLADGQWEAGSVIICGEGMQHGEKNSNIQVQRGKGWLGKNEEFMQGGAIATDVRFSFDNGQLAHPSTGKLHKTGAFKQRDTERQQAGQLSSDPKWYQNSLELQQPYQNMLSAIEMPFHKEIVGIFAEAIGGLTVQEINQKDDAGCESLAAQAPAKADTIREKSAFTEDQLQFVQNVFGKFQMAEELYKGYMNFSKKNQPINA